MKTNRSLLLIFFLSLLAYIVNLRTLRYVLPDHLRWLSTLQMWMAVGFHALPAFCIQRFALQTAKRRWLAALPTLLLLCWLLYCGWGLMTSQDNLAPLFWFILLFCSIAPAIGCALAWGRTPGRNRHAP